MIDDDEFLYRKVPLSQKWYDPVAKDLKPFAFKPREDDTEGISLDRARSSSNPEFRTIEQAAAGRSPSGYFVAVLNVGVLRAHGFTVKPDPIEAKPGLGITANPGHVLLADLTYSLYKVDKPEKSREKMALLAHKLIDRVEGPFGPESGDYE